MNVFQKYTPFLLSALLMSVVLIVIYPHYQYYIDPDGTAYLTIAKRYATGDIQTAINGYWSPWSCWLTALLMKAGIAAIPASVVINGMGALGFLYVSQLLFLKFGIAPKLQWLFSLTLGLFLCYAIFWQSFDDLWECFFLLGALRIMLVDDFRGKPTLWVLCGVVGALAYFAKAYSFPFFILNVACCVYFICQGDKQQWLKISLVSGVAMVVCSLPWIMALHSKYGIWTTSTSGTLNMSWYLVGHPQWKEWIDLLIPPAYKDSPYYWEDPYLANGATPHFWDSWQLAGKQVLRVAQNLYKLMVSMIQLSVFFPVVFLVLVRFIVNGKARKTTDPKFTVALSFLLFPLGYLLVNFEARYLWYMLPLSMLAGGLFIQNHLSGKAFLRVLPWGFAASFLIYPAWGMLMMYDEGKEEYKIAEQLNALNIRGTFTAKVRPGREAQHIERIAYFSGNALYSIPDHNADEKKILAEMRRYHVKYYFAYELHPEYRSGLFDRQFHDERGVVFPEVTKGSIRGLRVFVVNP